MEPSFGGVNFFGPCPVSNRAELPNARQVTGYPGVVGVEVLELGFRTAVTEFAGLWVAATPADLGAFLTQMIALKRSGQMNVLVDTKGITSADAILDDWATEGESRWSPSDGGWAIAYRMRFLHIGYVPPQ